MMVAANDILSELFLKDPLGLKGGEVVVVRYDPRWPSLFDEAAAELRAALGTSILAVYHVGSTAVPGLCAKPILDVLVSVPDYGDAIELVAKIEGLEYEHRPEEDIPDRHFFRRPPRRSNVRTHHLSLAEPNSRHHRVTLAFRDALRRDPRLVEAYARLKMDLAERFPLDRPRYIEGKSRFIDQVLAAIAAG